MQEIYSIEKAKTQAIITIPCFNDTPYLEKLVRNLELRIHEMGIDAQILIVEDMSDSSELVRRLQQEFDNLLYIRNKERQGRTRSLLNAWFRFEVPVYVYMDADGATDLVALDALTNLIYGVLIKKQDMVIGSRYLKESRTKRPIIRKSISILYNMLLRLIFRTGISDHQCGFRALSLRAVQQLSELNQADADEKRQDYKGAGYGETEAIVLLKKLNYKIEEIPVHWTEYKTTTMEPRRLYLDIKLALAKIFDVVRKSIEIDHLNSSIA